MLRWLTALQIVRDFLMQCFQKDPNLRVSARKLLKHPWIVNACRSDAVVPKKSTQYDQAVKSVQQWNEALKSPNSSLRKTSRPVSSSPIPLRRERSGPAAPITRPNPALAKQKINADQFPSPNEVENDNWDNDFDSSITPSALQLPHLKPQDHYGGLLSARNLKAFASFESVAEESNWDDNFEGELTVKSPLQVTATDVLNTVRPITPKDDQVEFKKSRLAMKSPKRRATQVKGQQTQNNTGKLPPRKSNTVPQIQPQPTLQYQEDSEEDYSDLVLANDGAFEGKLILSTVSSIECRRFGHNFLIISGGYTNAATSTFSLSVDIFGKAATNLS